MGKILREGVGLRPLPDGAAIQLPPERWAAFPDGGTLFVHRPTIKKGDMIKLSKMTMIDVPAGYLVVVLSPYEVVGNLGAKESGGDG
jgi:hypothetical protein